VGAPDIDWTAAFEEHRRWLRTIVYARVGDPEAVDEVMQEVALAAVRQAAPLANTEKLAPWLYQLAARQALLYRRKLGRQRKMDSRYAEQTRPTEQDQRTPDPLHWLLAAERRRLVLRALNRLRGKDREILLLKYTQNWSYRQLAGTIRSRRESSLWTSYLRRFADTCNVFSAGPSPFSCVPNRSERPPPTPRRASGVGRV
jgi:RNA polymerase sigma-70 factor (ECF subfamily)